MTATARDGGFAKFSDSGGSAESRRAEADKRVEALRSAGALDQMTDREREFVEGCDDPFRPISPKMIFWLRDLEEKYT